MNRVPRLWSCLAPLIVLPVLGGCGIFGPSSYTIQFQPSEGDYRAETIPVDAVVTDAATATRLVDALTKGGEMDPVWGWFSEPGTDLAQLRSDLEQKNQIQRLEISVPADSSEIVELPTAVLIPTDPGEQPSIVIIANLPNAAGVTSAVRQAIAEPGGSYVFDLRPNEVDLARKEPDR